MAFFSKAKEKKRARMESSRQGLLAATAMETQKAAQTRTTSAEQAKARIYGLLGKPGTYDLPGTAGGGGGTPGAAAMGDVFQKGTAASQIDPTAKGLLQYKSSLSKDAKAYWGTEKTPGTGERTDIIDPEKYTEAVSQSGEFRMRSRMTSEAEELLAQKGPAWDRLQQSTLGTISEGAATQLREASRELKNQAAKGGSARRAALTTANKIVAQEKAMQMRVNETWQANLKLFDFVHQNAEATMEGNRKFLDNLPLISQQYTSTMNGLAETMVQATRVSSEISQAGYETRAIIGDSDFLGKLIVGSSAIAGGVVMSYFGNPQGGAAAMDIGTGVLMGKEGGSAVRGEGAEGAKGDAVSGALGLLEKGTSWLKGKMTTPTPEGGTSVNTGAKE